MKELKISPAYWLVVIFILAFGFRLFFAFQTPYFSQDSYFAVRQVDSILETGQPVFTDDLSYSGRVNVFSPAYYYVLAGFAFFMGDQLALKVIPALFISLLVIIAYLIGKELTEDANVSLLIAFFAGFIPAFFLDVLNAVSPLSLFLPLILLCMYFFLNIRKGWNLYLYIISVFFMGILSPLSFLFVLGLIIFLLLIKLDYKKTSRLDLELALFSIFFILWIQFLFYKKAFLFHGFSVVWQNIPPGILSNYFKTIALGDVIYAIGLLPLFFGIFAVYKYILKEKNRDVYFIVAFALSVSLLLWLRLIEVSTGLLFLGAVLLMLSSLSFKIFFNYFEKTKAARFRTLLWIGVIVVFCITSIATSVAWASSTIEKAPTEKEMKALGWMRENLGQDSVILATPSEGFLISAIAQRKNVADNNFLLVKESDVIFKDINAAYTTKFETQAIEILDKYKINFIYISPRIKEAYAINKLAYVNERCLPLVYDDEVLIYQVRCHVKND
ncbi:MAG: hypothetical protein KJ574_02820 [Nanoarchaeota archaeon]|nr:hypothetical protein [Nanoarchaeota archaeon]